jgi:hypothetical protein
VRALVRPMFDRISAVSVLLVVPSLALAAPTWVGNFETGDLSQWGAAQRVSEDRVRVVTEPTWEGRYALAATVMQGDDPINASGNRAELVGGRLEPDGSEAWYRWAVLFPEDFPASPKWQLFTQWHHDGCCGSPPVEFHVTGEQVIFTVQGRSLWKTPLVRGAWHELMLHVRWSADPSVGFAELWYDGVQALPRSSVATAFPGMRNYLKVGYYRDASIQPTSTVFVDGMVQGATRADVEPLVAPTDPTGAPPDAGTQDSVLLSPEEPAAPSPSSSTDTAPARPPAAAILPSEAKAPGCAFVPLGAVGLLAALSGRRRRRQ